MHQKQNAKSRLFYDKFCYSMYVHVAFWRITIFGSFHVTKQYKEKFGFITLRWHGSYFLVYKSVLKPFYVG